jgi:hypothetical protein
MARDGDQQAPEATGLAVATFAQRPDLLDKVFGPEIHRRCRNLCATIPWPRSITALVGSTAIGNLA